ncbi:hypothetical protein DYH10_02335 [Candidatus Saccharibacteria bacterium CPR2]|nr:hypothetical protein [Candidatus Saccharibacteria bacterium CPR2]
MSDYYNGKRSRNIYNPASKEPFKLSRSKIDLFLECPRCFYIDIRLGVGRPPGYPFTLNSAVDNLLKNEFDLLRKSGDTHKIIKDFNVDAKPAEHKMLGEWRENFKGIRYLDEKHNLIITGAIDDLWINSKNEYIVVDYKATAKSEPVKELTDASHHQSYKKQLEVYQWLLRKSQLKVSEEAYLVYCTGRPNEEKFDACLNFDINLIMYKGNTDWVEPTIEKMKTTLDSNKLPKFSADCDYCKYVSKRLEVVEDMSGKKIQSELFGIS